MSLILVPSIILYLLVCSTLTHGRTRKFIPPHRGTRGWGWKEPLA